MADTVRSLTSDGASFVNGRTIVSMPMMGFLDLPTVVVLAGMRTEMRLSRREAWLLLVRYAVFVAWLVLESVGMTSVIRP